LPHLELVRVRLGHVVDDPLLERLDVEHLHLDHIRGALRVHTLDVDDRVLELADLGPLLRRQERDRVDAVAPSSSSRSLRKPSKAGLWSSLPKIRWNTKSVFGSAKTGRTIVERCTPDRGGAHLSRGAGSRRSPTHPRRMRDRRRMVATRSGSPPAGAR